MQFCFERSATYREIHMTNTFTPRTNITHSMQDMARRVRYAKMSLDAASDPTYPIDTRLNSLENALSFFEVGSFRYNEIVTDYPELVAQLVIRNAGRSVEAV